VSYSRLDPILPIKQVASVELILFSHGWRFVEGRVATTRGFYGVLAVAIVLVLAGCAKRTPTPTPAPTPTPRPAAGSAPSAVVAAETGVATYYADSLEGRRTASGTAFDNRTLVAAHPSLPLGSVVRVTNLENKRAVVVQIVDRGPTDSVRAGGVIIDVSRAAAEQLDFIRAGRAKVRVEVLKRGQ
jgi:rare lipoprotein A